MATEIRYQNGVVIVEPHGKIVGNSVSELQTAILPEVKAFDQPRILINLEHARRMSSSGLGVLMQAFAITKRKDGRMGIIHAGRHIKNLLVLSRLTSLFEHFDNEADAVYALSTDPQTV
jgi:anti-sigma B factor antagonist